VKKAVQRSISMSIVWMNMFRSAFSIKKIVIFTLVFQLGLGQSLVLAQVSNGPSGPRDSTLPDINDPSVAKELAQQMAAFSPSERENMATLLQLGDQIDGKKLAEANVPTKDFHLLGKQYIEYLRDGKVIRTVNLSEPQINLPAVAYMRLQVRYDGQQRQLVFEGIRGENERGENGEVVVRQVIGGVDLKAMSQDKELLVYLDSKGALNAINFQFVKAAIFKSAVPVFTNLWKPIEGVDLSEKRAFIEFRNRESTPIDFSILPETTVLPRSESGEIVQRAGDVLAGFEENGQVKYLGLFNRAMIAEDILKTSEYAYQVGVLTQGNEKLVRDLIGKIERDNDAQDKFERYVLEMSPLERKALAALSPQALGTMKVTAQSVLHETKSPKDQYTESENLDWAAKSLQSLQARYVDDNIGKLADPKAQKILQTALANGQIGYGGHFDSVDQPVVAERIQSTKFFEPTRASVLLSASARFLGKWQTLTFLGVGYLSFPFLHDQYEMIQQIKILSWSYHHLYTDVWRDLAYRNYNVRSQIQLLLLIPGAMLASASSGWLLKAAARMTDKSDSHFARRVRDLAAVWGDMGVWQRIVTFSNRYYAMWVYPILRIKFSHILRQKGLFSGLQSGLVNFNEKVRPDSPIGQKLNLKKTESVLFNNPLEASISVAKYLEPLGIKVSPKIYAMTDAKSQAVAQKKESIQLLLKEQKARYRKLSWAFAAIVVSESTGVDPATLTAAMENGNSIFDLEAILKDAEKSKKWELIAEELFQSFREMDVLKGNLEGKVEPTDIAKMVASARHVAERLNSSKSASVLATLKMKFRRAGLALAKGTAEYSMDKVEILRNSIPNKDVYTMVAREFVLDHIPVVGIPANFGERANLNDPDNLAASEKGPLNTNPRHLYDVAFNAYAHLFLSGAANTLTYYVHTPERETGYDPIEYQTLKIAERSETMLKSLVQFGRYLLPDKSDIGGVILRDLGNRLKTVQSAIYVAVFLRGFAYGAAPTIVSHTFFFTFFSSIVWWGFIWYPMQLGSKLTSKRVQEINDEMMATQLKISRALRGIDGERSAQLLEEGYLELIKSYQDHSPKVLEEVLRVVSGLQNPEVEQMRKQHADLMNLKNQSEKFDNGRAVEYFGLLAKLAVAIKTNDTDSVQKITEYIQQVNSADLTDLEIKSLKKLSAESLLAFAIENPPRTNQAHPFIPWLATQTAVLVSTYLAISWSVTIMDPKLLLDPGLIPKWMVYWAGFYLGSYLLLRKAPYEKVKGYLGEQWSRVKESWIERAIKNSEYMPQESKLDSSGPNEIRMCQSLFK
jgi:hypothetical protein